MLKEDIGFLESRVERVSTAPISLFFEFVCVCEKRCERKKEKRE